MPAVGESGIAARLRRLGLELPEPPRPLGRYVPALVTGRHLVLSGMLPFESGRLAVSGRLGETVSIESGRRGAMLAALNALAVAAEALGSLERLQRVVRASVSMATSAAFTVHASVADGASELFAALFTLGHTRTVSGAHSLPLGATVLLDVTFELDLSLVLDTKEMGA